MAKSRKRLAGASLLLSMACAHQATAADINAADYTALPPGTNLALWYQQYTEANSYHPDGGSEISNGTGVKANISILRLIHFGKLGKFTIDPQILLPFGHVYDVRVGGQYIGSTSGMADPIVGGTLWLINDPKAGASGRYLGITPLVYIPAGKYDHNEPLNMGENRWRGDLQIGWIEPLGGKWGMDLAGHAIFYGDNDEFGPAKQTLKQDTSYHLQGYLRYDFNPQQRLALGYAAVTGGKRHVDGAYTGEKLEYQQVRVEFQQFFSPRVQVLAQLSSDTHVEGGFKNDIGVKLRALMVF